MRRSAAYARRWGATALTFVLFAALAAAPMLSFGAPEGSGKRQSAARVKALKDLKRRDKKARRKAAHALGRLGGAGVVLALDKALGDTDKRVRLHAIRSLGFLRGKKAVAKLKKLAASEDAGERELAEEALSRIGTQDAVAPVASACRKGKKSACRSLQWAEDADSVSALKAALASKDSSTRSSAAFSLARRGETKGLQEIALALLTDPDPQVRIEAVYTLGILGDKGVLETLEAALSVETHVLTKQVLQLTVEQFKP